MTTLHDHLRESAATQERALDLIDRPQLRGRARKQRTVAQVLATALATLGIGAVVGVGFAASTLLAAGDDGPLGGPVSVAPAAAPYREALIFDGTGLLTAVPEDTVVVDVYLDPMCPGCASFGTAVEPQLLAMDNVTVAFHPIAFLDRLSSDGDYSTRASSAIQEVAAGSPERLGAFLAGLWAHQPEEESTLSDDDLAQLAADAGVAPDVIALFPQHRYASDVEAALEAASASGVDRVPYVVIDGAVFERADGGNWDGVIAAVEAAKAARGL